MCEPCNFLWSSSAGSLIFRAKLRVIDKPGALFVACPLWEDGMNISRLGCAAMMTAVVFAAWPLNREIVLAQGAGGRGTPAPATPGRGTTTAPSRGSAAGPQA